MPVKIKEFETLEGFWRIDWLGRIVTRGVEGPIPRIAVHLAQLRPGFEDPLSNLSLAQPHQSVQVLIDVGLIALLRIGSVWHKGVEIKPPKALAHDTFSVRWQDFQLTRLDGRIELNGNSVPVLPPYRHKVGGTAYRDIGESWLATAISSTSDGRLSVLLIPSTVLFQATLASSPATTRHLIHGEINKIVDLNYGYVTDEINTFRIELFKNFRDVEGPAIANASRNTTHDASHFFLT